MNYTFDSEIHILPLAHDYAYIICEVSSSLTDINDPIVRKIREDFTKKYCEYLINYAKEDMLQILTNMIFNNSDPDVVFIFRPAHVTENETLKGTCGLKFKRYPEDNLCE